MTSYPIHPAAELAPLMDSAAFAALKADIAANGLHDPIELLDGAVIDGRHRQNACIEADVKPRYVDAPEAARNDPAGYVESKNIHRRHLTPSQIAIFGVGKVRFEAERAAERSGARTDLRANLPGGSDFGRARDIVAKFLNVSPRTLETAKAVVERGAVELVDAVRRGEVAVSAAAEVAKLPEAEQRAVVAEGPKAVTAAAKKVRTERAAAKPPHIEANCVDLTVKAECDGELVVPERAHGRAVEATARDGYQAARVDPAIRELLQAAKGFLADAARLAPLIEDNITYADRRQLERLRAVLSDLSERAVALRSDLTRPGAESLAAFHNKESVQ